MNKREQFFFDALTKAQKCSYSTFADDSVHFYLTPGFKGAVKDFYRYQVRKDGRGFAWVPNARHKLSPTGEWQSGEWVRVPKRMAEIMFAVAFPILFCDAEPDRWIS